MVYQHEYDIGQCVNDKVLMKTNLTYVKIHGIPRLVIFPFVKQGKQNRSFQSHWLGIIVGRHIVELYKDRFCKYHMLFALIGGIRGSQVILIE